MGSMVTQTRNLDAAVISYPWSYDRNTFHSSGTRQVATRPRQTTTSWRTGRQDTAGDDTDLNIRKWSDSYKTFRDEMINDDPRRRYDNGHPFSTERQWFTNPGQVGVSGPGGRRYFGPLVSNTTLHNNSLERTYPLITPADLDWYGTKAISITAPTNPVASLSTTLAELKREGFPGISAISQWGKHAEAHGPGEFLNFEFGWKPLVGEIANVARVVRHGNKILRQYHRDSGKVVRRAMSFPIEQDTIVYPEKGGEISGPVITDWNQFFKNGVQATRLLESVTTTRRIWFSGAYSYHLATGDDFISKVEGFEQQVAKLFGIRINPGVLWNLAPWSWLSDWFANIGDVLENASKLADDGLVVRYGYLMCETTRTREVVLKPNWAEPNAGLGEVVFTWSTTKKERIQATPYGFGKDPADFSLQQWSILAALGLTKSPNKLRVDGN